MVIMYLLGWWYGRGWTWVLSGTMRRLNAINQTFSVPILLKTLFYPWKQIQTAGSFGNFFQSALDNFVSRWIGATIRIGMLIIAGLSTFALMLTGLIIFILWPLLPLLIILLPLASLLRIGF